MSITQKDKPICLQLNATTKMEMIKCSEDYFNWTERALIREDADGKKTFSMDGLMNGNEVCFVHTEDCIVFYKYDLPDNKVTGREYLVIIGVVDLHKLERISLTKKQELQYFKLCYMMQVPPREELEIIEVDENPKRRVHFVIPKKENSKLKK